MNGLRRAAFTMLVALAAVPGVACGGSDSGELPAPLPDGGSGGTPNTEGGTPTTDGGGGLVLGRSCASDVDCGVFTCVKPTDDLASGYGPPNGVCSRQCDSDSVCIPYGGVCVGFDPTASKGWCVETCTPGAAASGATKCHARADEACTPVGTHSYVCWPSCASDADCGSRKCELATGFCTATVAVAAPIGTPCDPSAPTDPCAPGYCQSISASDAASPVGFCTAPCRLGGLAGCGYSRNPISASTGVVGACYPGYRGLDGDGDQGLCWQLCDVASDCLDPTAACDQTERSSLNHGLCQPGATDGGGVVAPDAGKVLGRTCTTDADCGSFTCLKPTDDFKPGSGPPNGICSRTCADDTACAAYGGLCVSYGAALQGWCLEQCAPGSAQPTAQKCHARGDESCTALDALSYVCKPACTSDADCATRKCDLFTGLCATTPSTAKPIGTPCDPNAATSECAPGFCQSIAASGGRPAMAFCSAPCRLGGQGCGYTTKPIASVTGPVATCAGVFSPLSIDGDEGFCWQLCDQSSQCLDTRLGCDMLTLTDYGHGYCDWPVAGDGGVEGGVDAKGDAPVRDAGDASAE